MQTTSIRNYAHYFLCFLISSGISYGQSLGNAGTIQGSVADPSGAAIPNATVVLTNPVSGYRRTVVGGSDGSFRINSIPPNPYHLEVSAAGFSTSAQDVDIRNSIPVQVRATLAVAGSQTTVNVDATAATLENDPSAHVDVDRSLLLKLPVVDPAAGLSQAIVYSTGELRRTPTDFFIHLATTRKSAS